VPPPLPVRRPLPLERWPPLAYRWLLRERSLPLAYHWRLACCWPLRKRLRLQRVEAVVARRQWRRRAALCTPRRARPAAAF
jgi:hypothetical protein